MTSSSKKKKQKNAAFQKVKLKVGKKIPKGNIVDTTFKAKKIVIKEQLKSDSRQKNGAVKKDIKEFLSKLQHYNSTVRLDALKNLKESLTVFPELVTSHLHSLIEKLSVLLTDMQGDVRKLTTNLLKLVFSKIQSDQIVPFLPVIIAHLRCAMTHITHEIQSDSLRAVDLLIDCFPQHLKHFSQCFFNDFLNQISSQIKSFSTCASDKNNVSKRALMHDPSRKVTSISWYLQVCNRLKNFLKAVLENDSFVSTDQGKENSPLVRWENNKRLFIPLYGSCQCVISEVTSCVNNRKKDFFGDKSEFQAVISNLMPLLFDMWIEASSLNEDIAARNQLLNKPLEIYMCVVEIINLLWKIIDKWQSDNSASHLEGWFVTQFGNSFITHCMASFPYAKRFVLAHKNSKEKTETVNAVQLNLLLCEVVTRVASAKKLNESKYLSLSRNYVMGILSDGRQLLNLSNVELIIEILKQLLTKDKWQDNQRLLDCIQTGLKRLHPGSKCCKCFFNLLSAIIQQRKYFHLYRLPSFMLWVAELPAELLKYDIIPWSLLDVMKKAAPQGQLKFLESLKLYLPEIVAKLPAILVDGGEVVDAQKIIVDMLYWIPYVDTSLFTLIVKLCIDQKINANLSAYIIQVLNSRYKRHDAAVWCGGSVNYFGFLLSFILGSSKAELTDLENTVDSAKHCRIVTHLDCGQKLKIINNSPWQLVHQRNLAIIGIAAMQLIASDADVQVLTEGFLDHLFSSFQLLPLRCVCSVLLLCSRLWHLKVLPQKLLSSVVSLTLSSLEIAVTDDEMTSLLIPLLTEVMCVPGISDSVCYQLHLLTLDVTTSYANVVGEILLTITKLGHLAYPEILMSALNELQARHADVETTEWYLKAKYELRFLNNG